MDDGVRVRGRLGQAVALPAGEAGAQRLPAVEPDQLLGNEPPPAGAVAAAALPRAVVGLQALPQPKLRAAVTESRLLLDDLAVEQLVASPLVGQREQVGLGRLRRKLQC